VVKLYHCLAETLLNELVGTLLYDKAYTSSCTACTGALYGTVVYQRLPLGRVSRSVTLQHLGVTVAALNTCLTRSGSFQGAGGR